MFCTYSHCLREWIRNWYTEEVALSETLMPPSNTVTQSCKTSLKQNRKKMLPFFSPPSKKNSLFLLHIPLWIKAEERDSGLMVTAVTPLWLICSLHLCEMQAWLWYADTLLVFSRGWNTEGFWICRGLMKLPFFPARFLNLLSFFLTAFFSLFFNHPSCFHASSYLFHIFLSLSVGLKNICPAQTCNPFSRLLYFSILRIWQKNSTSTLTGSNTIDPLKNLIFFSSLFRLTDFPPFCFFYIECCPCLVTLLHFPFVAVVEISLYIFGLHKAGELVSVLMDPT